MCVRECVCVSLEQWRRKVDLAILGPKSVAIGSRTSEAKQQATSACAMISDKLADALDSGVGGGDFSRQPPRPAYQQQQPAYRYQQQQPAYQQQQPTYQQQQPMQQVYHHPPPMGANPMQQPPPMMLPAVPSMQQSPYGSPPPPAYQQPPPPQYPSESTSIPSIQTQPQYGSSSMQAQP